MLLWAPRSARGVPELTFNRFDTGLTPLRVDSVQDPAIDGLCRADEKFARA